MSCSAKNENMKKIEALQTSQGRQQGRLQAISQAIYTKPTITTTDDMKSIACTYKFTIHALFLHWVAIAMDMLSKTAKYAFLNIHSRKSETSHRITLPCI